MSKNISITEKITSKLLNELRNGSFQGADHLPPEQDMASMLGVSRTAIRDALSILEREGFISRKRGVGTIINHHVLQVKTRVDLEQEFSEMILNIGKTPSSKIINYNIIPAETSVAVRLKIEEHSSVLCIKRLISADLTPAILCTDYISMSKIHDHNFTEQDISQNIFDFMEQFGCSSVYMDVSEIRAVAADYELAKLLNVALAAPLLMMSDVGYTIYGEPILCSDEYYVDGIFTHTLMRKKI